MSKLRSAAFAPIWQLMRLSRRAHARKRVLLVVGNDMNARYAGAVEELLRDDARIAMYTTGGSGDGAAARRFADETGAVYRDRVPATLQWWDLIIFAAHHAPSHFHPDIPKLFIHHSHDSGKKAAGEDHRYGARFVVDAAGRPYYTAILEMSEHTRARIEHEMPALRGTIRVVGDLMADRLLEDGERRHEVRHSLGIEEDRTAVLLMSTWGPDSMMETMGHEIIESAAALTDRYAFILSTHPNHWTGPHAISQPWGQHLLAAKDRGFHVIEPHDEWSDFALAADLAITDHTSLAVTFALLGKPMFFVPVDIDEIAEGTIGHALYEALPRLESPAELEALLEHAEEGYPRSELLEIAGRINSHPGEAAGRILAEIHRLLGIT